MRFPAIRRASVVIAALTVRTTPAAAHEGWGIVVDAHRRVYVADIPANTVWRISPDGRVEPVVRDVHSHALVLGSDGAVYGTHVHLTRPIRSVWRLDMSGRLSDVLPPTSGFPLDLQPFLLGADGTLYSGSVYQAEPPAGGRELYVLRRSPRGVVDTVAGGRVGHADGVGPRARFESLDGMAWLPDGAIVIADGPRLRRVTLDGHVATITGPLTTRRWDQDLLGVSVGPHGDVYAADFAGRAVLHVVGTRADTALVSGRFWSPTGVTATAGGLYVLEHPRAPLGILGDLGVGPYLRVRRLGPDGRVETLARVWGRHSGPAAGAAALLLLALTGAWARRRMQRRE